MRRLRTLGWPVIAAVAVVVVLVTSTTVALVSHSSPHRIIGEPTRPSPSSATSANRPGASPDGAPDTPDPSTVTAPTEPGNGSITPRPRVTTATKAGPPATVDWASTLDITAVLNGFYTPDTPPQILYRSELPATGSQSAVVIVAANVGKSTNPNVGGERSLPRTLIAAITRNATGAVFLASDYTLFSHLTFYPAELSGTLSSYSPTPRGVRVAYTADSTSPPAGAPTGTDSGRGDFTLDLTWNGQQLAGQPVEVTRPCTPSDYPHPGDPKSVASMQKGHAENLWISIPAPTNTCWIEAGPMTLTGTAPDGTMTTWSGPAPSYHLDAAYPTGMDYVRLISSDLECEGTTVTQYVLRMPLGLTFSFSGTCSVDGIKRVGVGASAY